MHICEAEPFELRSSIAFLTSKQTIFSYHVHQHLFELIISFPRVYKIGHYTGGCNLVDTVYSPYRFCCMAEKEKQSIWRMAYEVGST